MTNAKTLSFLSLLGLAVMALAGSAQAASLTAPSGTVYTGELKASNEGAIVLDGTEKASCGNSELKANIETHGNSVTAKGKVLSLTFSECTQDVSVVTNGQLELHPLENGDSTVTAPGLLITTRFTVGGSNAHCVYGSTGNDLGTLKAAPGNAGNAVLELGASLPLAGGDEACTSSATLTGTYKVVSPTGLRADSQVTPAGIVTANGAAYTSVLSLANENGKVVFDNESWPMECNLTMEGAVEQHGATVPIKAPLSTVELTACTGASGWTITVNNPGSLELGAIGNSDATVIWNGATYTMVNDTFGLTCRYAPNSTDLGRLTGSTTTGKTATIDVEAEIPFESGSAFCPAKAVRWTGNLLVTVPDNLVID